MNKRERKTIEWCIEQLMADDGDYTSAIGKLCELIGGEYPMYTLLRDNSIESKTVPEIMSEMNGKESQKFSTAQGERHE